MRGQVRTPSCKGDGCERLRRAAASVNGSVLQLGGVCRGTCLSRWTDASTIVLGGGSRGTIQLLARLPVVAARAQFEAWRWGFFRWWRHRWLVWFLHLRCARNRKRHR